MSRFALALLVFCLFIGGAVWGEEPATARPPSPHADPAACATCHAPVARGARPDTIPFAKGTVDDTCRSCHEKAPHQVGIEAHRRGDPNPSPDKARVPMSFLLDDGKLSCMSCHREAACDGRSRDPANPRFFRGGPYKSLGRLCENCHAPDVTVRFDPHSAMAEKRDTTAICQFCHRQPEGEGERETLLTELKVDAESICRGCHKDTRHAGTVEHLQALDKETSRRATDAGLPLTPDRRIYCATCHDPHPAGSKKAAEYRMPYVGQPITADPTLRLALEPMLTRRANELGIEVKRWEFEPDHLRLPLRGNELCGTCHHPADIEKLRREKAASQGREQTP